MRVKIFIDFWNFQLDWNHYLGKDHAGKPIQIPWKSELPRSLCDAIKKKHGEGIQYCGTHVYASVDPGSDSGLRRFLHAMDSFPGYSVLVKERKARRGTIHCANCNHSIDKCPECSKQLRRTVEKGIDTAIITNMIQMAYDDTYDLAILGSTDADFCDAVTFVQSRLNKQVYNLWFQRGGTSLRNSCWDHLRIDDLLSDLGIARQSG